METLLESEALICLLMDHLFAFHFPWGNKFSVNLSNFECNVHICWYLKKRATHIQVFTSLSCIIGFKIKRLSAKWLTQGADIHLIKWWIHCKYLVNAFNKLMNMLNIKLQKEFKSLNCIKFKIAYSKEMNRQACPQSWSRVLWIYLHESTLFWFLLILCH